MKSSHGITAPLKPMYTSYAKMVMKVKATIPVATMVGALNVNAITLSAHRCPFERGRKTLCTSTRDRTDMTAARPRKGILKHITAPRL